MKQFDQDLLRNWLFSAISFAISLFLLVCLCAMCGCTKTVYLPAESRAVSNDTLIQTRWLTDYRVEKDSVFVMVKGDSVLIKDTKWRTRDIEKHDTVYVAKRDTVTIREPYPVEKTVEVEKPLKWWQKSLMWVGGLTLFGGVLYLVIKNYMRKI